MTGPDPSRKELKPLSPLDPNDAKFERLAGPDDYPAEPVGPLAYLPILGARGVVLGLLWASLDDKAADFRPNPATRPASDRAHVLWVQRLRDARRYETAPLTLLERVAADPRHRTGPRQEAPSLSALPF